MGSRKQRDERLEPDEPDPESHIVRRDTLGRAFVKCPRWLSSMARADGYILLSRYRAAKDLGRPLRDDEVVLHLDDPFDDSIENLHVRKKRSRKRKRRP